MTKRRRFSAAEKAKVALEAIRGELTLAQIASKYSVHATQISKWKKEALQQLPESFSNPVKQLQVDHESELKSLYEQIGRLKIENGEHQNVGGIWIVIFTQFEHFKTLREVYLHDMDSHHMKTYFIKIALRRMSPMIWRRLQIPGNTSLAQLHHVIQIAYGWDNDYLHRFHIYGKDYGIPYEGGIGFSDNARRVYMDTFEFDVGDKFTYEYNFFEHWVVDIRIEKIKELLLSKSILYCAKGNGMPGVSPYDELAPTQNLLKAIANIDETTTVGDILPFFDELYAVRFNRDSINRRLQSEFSE